MKNKILIQYSLEKLNQTKNGETIFEILCNEIISKKLDSSFLPSTGLAAGGDGGIDGWGEDENGLIKYAFSINQEWKQKIKHEIDKTKLEKYKTIVYFTNQSISQNNKEKISNDYKGIILKIYDLENLVNFLLDDLTLGKVLDLSSKQNAITIDYLLAHNQFRDEISELLYSVPRKVYEIKSNSLENDSIPIIEYCQYLPVFTILEARAGYGKSVCLKSLHQHILYGEAGIMIPPVFIPLRDYTMGRLQSMIELGMSISGDYQVQDAILLLDGYDEVREDWRYNLLKEINQLVLLNSYIRKVILSVRENEYNIIEFKDQEWVDLRIIRLTPINENDVDLIFQKNGLITEDIKMFKENSFFLGLQDHIFYVIQFIDYFKTNKSISKNIIDLFNFLIEKEIQKIFRVKSEISKSIESMESIALFMTLHQRMSLKQEEIPSELIDSLKSNKFEFSHNNIKEFLAARIISRQNKETIIRLVAKGNKLIPFISNTFGFVLNLLIQKDGSYLLFEDLVQNFLNEDGNAKKLLLIESEKITPRMNIEILKATLSQEAKSGSAWEIPSLLATYCLREEVKEQNIQYLLSQINRNITLNEFSYFTSILRILIYQNKIQLNIEQENYLINLLLYFLSQKAFENYSEEIEDLLSIVCDFKIWKTYNYAELQSIKEKVLAIAGKGLIFDKFCRILMSWKIDIPKDLYFELLNFILSKKLNEIHLIANPVSRQVSDQDKINIFSIIYWGEFLSLTEIYLELHSLYLWDIYELLKKNYNEYFINYTDSKELEKYLSVLAIYLEKQVNEKTLTTVNQEFIVEWVNESASHFLVNPILEAFPKFKDKDFVLNFFKELFQSFPDERSLSYLFFDLLMQIIQEENDFDLFHNLFFDNQNTKVLSFYKFILHSFDSNSKLFPYIMKKVPVETLKEVLEYRNSLKESEKNLEDKKEKIAQDYKIAFNFESVKSEINSIFQHLGMEEISRGEIFKKYLNQELNEANQFALFLLKFSTDDDQKLINRSEFLSLLEDYDWNLNFMASLVRYCKHNRLDINSFSSNEIEQVINWIEIVLEKFPLDKADTPIENIHLTLAFVLRNIEIKYIPNDFQKKYGNKILGLSLAGFPSEMQSGIRDYFSIEYMDKFISVNLLLNFMNENMDKAFNNSRAMIGLCGYISNHITYLYEGIKIEIKGKLKSYIIENLGKDYYPTILNCAREVGFSVTEIEEELLSNYLILNIESDGLMHNYATSFLSYSSKSNPITNEEIDHLLKALLIAFNKAYDEFHKKTLAEYYLKFNSKGGDVFNWYGNYLMANDSNTMSHKFTRYSGFGRIYSKNINDLSTIESLLKYSQKENSDSERRKSIADLAISSYRGMASSVDKDEEFQLIKDSLNRLIQEGHNFMSRILNEIRDSYNERTYQPIKMDEIRELAKIR